MFTHGSKGKGKVVPGLPLADWVRGAEHLQEPREHLLSWGMEQTKPILKVTSVKGHREFRIHMKSETRELQVIPHSLEPSMFLITIDGRQASSLGESPLIIMFVMSDSRQNPDSEFLRSGVYFPPTALPSVPDKSKVSMLHMV